MSKKKTVFMGTTKIEVSKTIGEIQAYLTDIGVASLQIENDPKTKIPKALSFSIEVQDQRLFFQLPVRIEPVYCYFNRKRAENRQYSYKEACEVPTDKLNDFYHGSDLAQARKTAWRQILRWVEAQFALIDTGMVKPEEIFLPFLVSGNGETLFEAVERTKFKGLLTD